MTNISKKKQRSLPIQSLSCSHFSKQQIEILSILSKYLKSLPLAHFNIQTKIFSCFCTIFSLERQENNIIAKDTKERAVALR